MSLRQVANKTSRLISRGTRKIISHPSEAFLMLRMAWWVGVLSVAVQLRPLPRALRIVAGADPDPGDAKFDAAVGNQLARAIDQVLAIDLFVFKPICWKRATVLRRYLSSEGITSRILFGVRNDNSGGVAGHAWLESGGMPILESQPLDYVVTYTFPSNAPCTTELAIMSHEQN
ncbi:MAG TPA: lasso peptide biosynthesis B2 protein [Pyrinomonadaceae bacterium]|nr:lasso peptide biosynthesis B2 protein [Pyrinomonadaceae bacterium]